MKKSQPDADHHSEADVDQRQREQVAADPERRFADGLSGHGQIGAAGQAQHLVAHLLALLQQEIDEDDHQERRQRRIRPSARWPGNGRAHSFFRDHADFQVGLVRLLRRLGDFLDRVLDQSDRTARAHVQKTKLVLQVAAVAGDLFGQAN